MLNKKSSHLVTLSVYYISQSHIEQYLQEFEENLMMLFIWCWTLPGTWFFPNVKLYLLVWVHKGQFSLTRRSTQKRILIESPIGLHFTDLPLTCLKQLAEKKYSNTICLCWLLVSKAIAMENCHKTVVLRD